MKNLFITTLALLALTLTNCKKDAVTPPADEPQALAPLVAGKLDINFKAIVGDSQIVFNTGIYTNQAGNTFNVTMFKYYISNIKVTKTDNSVWTEPNSYHLIDHSNSASTVVTMLNVPFGNYKAIEFMIGVDSVRNNSGATGMTGALDPSNNMYWGWNQGYIMAKFEGTSPQSSATGNNLKYHIGGWNASLAPNVLKIVSPSFNNDTAKVTTSASPTIHITSDLLEWFKTPTVVDFSTMNTVHMPGANAKTIADNYADMFLVDRINN